VSPGGKDKKQIDTKESGGVSRKTTRGSGGAGKTKGEKNGRGDNNFRKRRKKSPKRRGRVREGTERKCKIQKDVACPDAIKVPKNGENVGRRHRNGQHREIQRPPSNREHTKRT